MFAFAHMMNLFPDELASLGRRGPALAFGAFRALDGPLFRQSFLLDPVDRLQTLAGFTAR